MLAVSSAAADYCRWSYGLSAEVLPNVVDYKLFHAAKPLPQYSDDTPTVLFLGRLVPRKGPMLLVQAAKQLADKGLKFRLIICGSGPLKPKLEAYIKANGLQPYVELAGYVSEADKRRYYASADVAAFPSSGGESFGIVLLEAMSSGQTVVLAGDNPGYRTVMEPHTELLFNPRNATELTDKIEYYLTHRQAADKLRRWSGDYAAKFDTATVGERLVNIYRQALRKRRRL